MKVFTIKMVPLESMGSRPEIVYPKTQSWIQSHFPEFYFGLVGAAEPGTMIRIVWLEITDPNTGRSFKIPAIEVIDDQAPDQPYWMVEPMALVYMANISRDGRPDDDNRLVRKARSLISQVWNRSSYVFIKHYSQEGLGYHVATASVETEERLFQFLWGTHLITEFSRSNPDVIWRTLSPLLWNDVIRLYTSYNELDGKLELHVSLGAYLLTYRSVHGKVVEASWAINAWWDLHKIPQDLDSEDVLRTPFVSILEGISVAMLDYGKPHIQVDRNNTPEVFLSSITAYGELENLLTFGQMSQSQAIAAKALIDQLDKLIDFIGKRISVQTNIRPRSFSCPSPFQEEE